MLTEQQEKLEALEFLSISHWNFPPAVVSFSACQLHRDHHRRRRRLNEPTINLYAVLRICALYNNITNNVAEAETKSPMGLIAWPICKHTTGQTAGEAVGRYRHPTDHWGSSISAILGREKVCGYRRPVAAN